MGKKIITVSIILLLSIIAVGIGISVSPGTFLLQNVPIGEKYNITAVDGYRIKIGKDSGSKVYILTPRKPSDDGTKATGFYDFPEPSWFHLQRDMISLFADSTSTSEMWLTFPDDPSLYNRHFLLGVDVSPTVGSTSGMVAVGAYLLYRFETEPKADVLPELPGGEIAFVPSVIEFKNLGKSANVSKDLKIFRGETQRLNLKLYRLDPESEVAKFTILLTRGYRRAPEGIVYFPDNVTIDKDGGKIFIQVAYDKQLSYKRLEEIIIAESLDGKKAFLRVHLISE
ncbi:hypothetical protein J7L68_06610 [bacterium]|nr:hypothetical protein [bacterium]